MDTANPSSFTPQQLNQFESNPPQKPTRFRALLFLKIGLFEVGFVTVFLALFFLILSYFHVIHIASLPFFNSLSQPFTQEKVPFSPFITITPAPIYPVGTFFQRTLKPAYMPTSTTSQSFTKKLAANTPTVTWKNAGALFLYALSLGTQGTRPDKATIHIILATPSASASLTSQIATQLLSTYFLPLPDNPVIPCQNSTLCQLTLTDTTGKKLYGVRMSDTMTIFACMIPTNSPLFATATNCN